MLSIFDIEGREAMKIILADESNSHLLDVSSLNSGMYMMKAVSGNQVMMQKFTIEK